jgi:hypothetical protein
VAEEWRAICPVIAISGLFTFAWTASTLVEVVNSNHKLHDQIELESEKEAAMRAELGTEVRVLREKESAQEQALRARQQQDAAGKSFLQRHEMKKDTRREVEQLRAAENEQAKELKKTERETETRLGETPPGKDSEKES